MPYSEDEDEPEQDVGVDSRSDEIRIEVQRSSQ